MTVLSYMLRRSDFATKRIFVPNLWEKLLVAGLLGFWNWGWGMWSVSSPIPSTLIRGMCVKVLTKLFLHFLHWPGRGLMWAEPEGPQSHLLVPGFSWESRQSGNKVDPYTLHIPCGSGVQRVIKKIQTQERQDSVLFLFFFFHLKDLFTLLRKTSPLLLGVT